MRNPKVALIGAGAMGGALLRGWLARNVIDATGSAVFVPTERTELRELSEAHGFAVNPTEAGFFDAIVIAVKPQIAAEILPAFAALARNSLIVSVMAGKSIGAISAALGGAPRIIRAMPNLAARVGKSASGLYAPPGIGAGDREVAQRLIAAVGAVIWVEREAALDQVTALSGSGPAYFFALAEALAEAGEGLGLAREAAEALARATLVGAGALVEESAASVSALRGAVTSPEGTTAAALAVLDGDDSALRGLVKRAVAAAATRARALN